MSALRHVKPAVRALRAYTLAARAAKVKINQNENPYDLPAALKRRVLDEALSRPWSRYPDFDPRELLEALGRFARWRADGILAGNGSNELIEALLMVTVGAGTSVVIPEPTFSLYALMTDVLGGAAVRVPLGPAFEYDTDALMKAQREHHASVVIVCSPNNPTGTALAPEEVARLCKESDALVVVDEAYHEFAGQSVVPLLHDHGNLIVLRTFSKAMAMAGLRVGYLLASPELVAEVNKARLPYNLNFFSQAAALAVLSDPGAVEASVARLVRARESLLRDLAAIPGVRPYRSQANFILFALEGRAPADVFRSVYEQGVLVRDVSAAPRLSQCLRVSVGTDEENAAFLAALRRAMAAPATKERA
jgi:histidinol-phosphate aminotransferase